MRCDDPQHRCRNLGSGLRDCHALVSGSESLTPVPTAHTEAQYWCNVRLVRSCTGLGCELNLLYVSLNSVPSVPFSMPASSNPSNRRN